MSAHDFVYQSLVDSVLLNGAQKPNRTGTDTISIFNENYVIDLYPDKLPLLTSKRVSWKNVLIETLWYLRGDCTTDWLHRHGVKIWDPWASDLGHLGPVYGHQWRHGGIDQIQTVVDTLRTDPFSRRMVVSAWNLEDLHLMALPPCHMLFVVNVQNERVTPESPLVTTVNLHLTQRSCDVAIGLPYNMASYGLLTHMFACWSGFTPGAFAHSIVDAHVYTNHVDALSKQVDRIPRKAPTLTVDPAVGTWEGFCDMLEQDPPTETWLELFKLENYNPHPAVKFDVAV